MSTAIEFALPELLTVFRSTYSGLPALDASTCRLHRTLGESGGRRALTLCRRGYHFATQSQRPWNDHYPLELGHRG